MNGDEGARRLLQERLLDEVELPPDAVREAMFERTFASPPGAGQHLLPPDGFADPDPDDPDGGSADAGADGPGGDGVDADAGDPFDDDPFDDGGTGPAELVDPGVDHGFDADAGGDPDDGADHGDHGNHGDGAADHPAADW